MTDLLSRLRWFAKPGHMQNDKGPIKEAMSEAADEIERLRAALQPFADLCGPYDYDEATDDEVVRGNGTIGKDGDRGYAEITVADLRRADAVLSATEGETK